KSVRLLTFASSDRRWAELHGDTFRRLGWRRAAFSRATVAAAPISAAEEGIETDGQDHRRSPVRRIRAAPRSVPGCALGLVSIIGTSQTGFLTGTRSRCGSGRQGTWAGRHYDGMLAEQHAGREGSPLANIKRDLGAWANPRDLAQLFRRGVEAPDIADAH